MRGLGEGEVGHGVPDEICCGTVTEARGGSSVSV